jgi:predicted nucleic acid-binding protein
MKGPVVLDTSVVIKWFRQGEVLADQALALREAYLDGQIAITVPSLLAYELTNVLRYKGDLTTSQVQDAVQSLFDMRMEWVLPSEVAMRRAVEIARANETTVYDATFAVLAEALEATFITADERLGRCLATLPFVRFLGEMTSSPR